MGGGGVVGGLGLFHAGSVNTLSWLFSCLNAKRRAGTSPLISERYTKGKCKRLSSLHWMAVSYLQRPAGIRVKRQFSWRSNGVAAWIERASKRHEYSVLFFVLFFK